MKRHTQSALCLSPCLTPYYQAVHMCRLCLSVVHAAPLSVPLIPIPSVCRVSLGVCVCVSVCARHRTTHLHILLVAI